jgi:hypothetical protein
LNDSQKLRAVTISVVPARFFSLAVFTGSNCAFSMTTRRILLMRVEQPALTTFPALVSDSAIGHDRGAEGRLEAAQSGHHRGHQQREVQPPPNRGRLYVHLCPFCQDTRCQGRKRQPQRGAASHRHDAFG